MKWWSAERKSEQVVVVMNDGRTETVRSEGPVAGCAMRLGEQRDCRARSAATHPSTIRGDVRTGPLSLGAFANVVATRNAGVRLPGGKPDEGELHVRFGERVLETERWVWPPEMCAQGKPWG